jgi:hypothetical protein
LLGTVDSQAIDTIRGDEIGDPGLERVQHICILSPQIRKRDDIVSFPADQDASCIAIINEAEGMEVGFLVHISKEQEFE